MLAGLVLATILLHGCGGGGQSSGVTAKAHGKLQFSVAWPTKPQSRVIPSNAQSILVSVSDSSGATQSVVIVNPATTTSFSEVPAGSATVTATAYANQTGTGTPLATATVSTTVTANTTSSVDVTLASTIDHLTVTPNPFTIGAGTASPIVVTAYDANGTAILIDPTTLSFTSSDSSIASVSPAGAVTAGTHDGSGTITITQSDSGKALSLPFSVVPTVTVGQGPANVRPHGTATYSANVVGPTDTSVSWSVVEGAAGGTITSGGVYTAPATHGTYHILATSVADPTRTSTFTVTVTGGNVGVTVN